MRRTPSKRKQRGWWQVAAAAGASLLGNALSNKQSEKNTALSYENQRNLRQTAYQDTVQDLQKAGLNPMLAYQNAATPAPQVPVAQNKSITEGLSNSAIGAMSMQNMEAQNELLKAQAAKTIAEAQAIPTSTANLQAQTTNLEATLPKIIQETRNLRMVNLKDEEQTALYREQNKLVQIEQELKKGAITFQEAQTRTQNVLTQLKKLEVPGAENAASWERSLGEYSKELGAAKEGIGAARSLGGLLNSARQLMRK